MREAISAILSSVTTRFFIVLTCTIGVAASAERLATRSVPDFVVPEIVLPISAPALRSILLSELRAEPERSNHRYKEHGFKARDGTGREQLMPAAAEERSGAVFGGRYFRDPAHSKDLYVHFMGTPIVSSYYYDVSTGKGLDYGVTFAVALEAVGDSRTKVSVRTVKSEAFVGKSLNLHAMGFVPKAVSVPASPLDQYRLLAYLADLAGGQLKPLEEDAEKLPR